MGQHEFLLPPYFDYSATLIWAVSGALLAARKGYAVMGLASISLVSCTGGGLLRDGLFLQDGPPVLLRSSVYLQIVVMALILVAAFGHRINRMRHFERVVVLVDALGLGAYAVVGMNRAMATGLEAPLAVGMVGMVNAVGGGVLRDLLMHREVGMFRPGTLEQASALVGVVLFLGLLHWTPMGQFGAAWITILAVFAVRMLAIRYNIESRPLPGYEQYWKAP